MTLPACDATAKHRPREEDDMHPDPPAPGGDASRRLRRLLVWSGLTLLVAMTLALAIVIASLALELGS